GVWSEIVCRLSRLSDGAAGAGGGEFVETRGGGEEDGEEEDDYDDRGEETPPQNGQGRGGGVEPKKGSAGGGGNDRGKNQHFQTDRRKHRRRDRADERRGKVRQEIRHDLQKNDLVWARTRQTRDLDIGALADREHLGADGAGRIQPGERGDDEGHLVDGEA